MPTADIAAQMARARARSAASGNTVPSIERVEGMIIAPPMPMKARVAMSASALPANAEAIVPTPNTASPAMSIPFRP